MGGQNLPPWVHSGLIHRGVISGGGRKPVGVGPHAAAAGGRPEAAGRRGRGADAVVGAARGQGGAGRGRGVSGWRMGRRTSAVDLGFLFGRFLPLPVNQTGSDCSCFISEIPCLERHSTIPSAVTVVVKMLMPLAVSLQGVDAPGDQVSGVLASPCRSLLSRQIHTGSSHGGSHVWSVCPPLSRAVMDEPLCLVSVGVQGVDAPGDQVSGVVASPVPGGHGPRTRTRRLVRRPHGSRTTGETDMTGAPHLMG
jgi:hypothetical protein